jgi:glycerophosphoryl diester phosphodiesterase
MKYTKTYIVATLFILLGCSKSEITPPVKDDSGLANTTPIPGTTMKKMEGIYKLLDGSGSLGSQFVCKVSKYRVSFFSDKDGIFIILNYGYKSSDGSIQFSGFYRYSELTTQGTIQFSMAAADGASDLLAGIISNFVLKGAFSGSSFTLHYDHAFTDYATHNPFMIFAHHGVQTTANPPYAENSLNGVLNDESYGVTGLEFDVRMTSDHVPICIHDPGINTRLTIKGPLSGSWDQYPFPFISEYVRLIDGQKVPSVEQVLNYFVDSTTLKYVWLDVKGNTDIFKYLEPVVRNAYAKAVAQNRDVTIFSGLPSADVIAEFNKQPTYKSNNPAYAYSLPLPTLAEQTLDIALENGSSFFGPRFSEGLLLDDVNRAHTNGIKVISWTLNGKSIITDYLKNGKFDGFITDYPAYVVYDFYTMF